MTIKLTDEGAKAGSLEHGGLTDGLAILQHLARLCIELQGAEVERLDGAVVTYLALRCAVLAGELACFGVELKAHSLTGKLTFVVSLIKGNLKFHGVPCADRRVLPTDDDGLGALGSRLRDGRCDTLDGLLLLGLDTSGLTGLVEQTTKLCISSSAESKHSH